jgi:hypothetical protein
MPPDPPRSPALRASDADRDQVIELLRAAVADGRLDPAEFNERLDATLTARTVDALTPLTADLAAVPSAPAPELVTIKEKHGTVRRDGRWTLPRRLRLRTAWSGVVLDLTQAVRGGPELVIDLKMSGGAVELILAPGMVVDANELAVRYGGLAIDRPDDTTPETLRVRLVGRMRHGVVSARWQRP